MIRRLLLILLLGPLNGFSQQTNRESLTHRLEALTRSAADSRTSHWHTVTIHGIALGGHQCPGKVAVLKAPDYGAMWSIAALTDLPETRSQLSSARNLKLEQLDPVPGFFQGAPLGDHFSPSEKRFISTRQVAPADLAEAIQDLGNVLLFAPNDSELRARLQLTAERLLAWQHEDGHWDAAYDRATQRAITNAPADFHPTFYGLFAAHRVLKDARYRTAARRGADWFVAHVTGTNITPYAKRALAELSTTANVTNAPPNDSAESPCPQHWQQMGSILDYLLREAAHRSGGNIDFPRGIIGPGGAAPPYGFMQGTIYGQPAFLKLPPGLITTASPHLEYLSALSIRGNRVFVIAMNNSSNDLTAKMKMDPARLIPGKAMRWVQGRAVTGSATPLDPFGNWEVKLPAHGLAVIQLSFQP